MPPFFRFRQFLVHHDRCAMKVGTDGVLLGAWANGGKRILDVGTGTGLIALMMAQRFPEASVDAVEIDEMACQQARENVLASPFARQINIWCMAVQEMGHDKALNGVFDSIVSNPPFFENALKNPDKGRSVARHSDALPFADLFEAVKSLLSEDGEFSAIIPSEYKSRFEEEAFLAGLSISRICAVKTTPRKPIRRYLMAFRKHPSSQFEQTTEILETSPNVRSPWYHSITKDFYI